MQAWDDLEPAWREAFRLAWEAFGAGTIPVGAVVTRGDEIIATGRNRLFERDAPAPELAGTRAAHAEMNALAHLPLGTRYRDCVLWTTLEPCPMCIGATWIASLGAVRFAGSDVYAGSSRLLESQLERSDRGRGYPLRVEGPLDGPFGVLGELLHIAWFVAERPEYHVTDVFREGAPELVALAERIRLDQHAAAPLEEVLPLILPEL